MDDTSAGFEIIAVTADKGIRAWGPDRPSVFRQAALGLWSLMIEPATVECRSVVPIAVEAEDQEALLVAWLNELLYLYEAKGFIGGDCAAQSLTDFCVEHLAKQKWPRSFDFVAALPRSEAGKVLRRALRERYWAGRERQI